MWLFKTHVFKIVFKIYRHSWFVPICLSVHLSWGTFRYLRMENIQNCSFPMFLIRPTPPPLYNNEWRLVLSNFNWNEKISPNSFTIEQFHFQQLIELIFGPNSLNRFFCILQSVKWKLNKRKYSKGFNTTNSFKLFVSAFKPLNKHKVYLFRNLMLGLLLTKYIN